jgi:DNA-binding winged helix-turn-helix (wHTH) protein
MVGHGRAVKTATQFFFGEFCLDVDERRLLRGVTPLHLTDKSLAVLRCLLEHAGRLVTKEQLLAAVWPGITVGEAVLKVHVGEVRKVLGDDARAPRYVETLHRRGYRFLMPVHGVPTAAAAARGGASSAFGPAAPASAAEATPLEPVGREDALDSLAQAWLRASAGRRQAVFVSGAPGIGKTTLVDAFVARLRATATVRVARGQCVDRHGAGEPYLPVLEAFERLSREPGGPRVAELLARCAPTWLAQMPSLTEPAETARLSHETLGATRERMLREMAEAIDLVSRATTLVLVLEDLHWSDPATVDLVVALATRREPARLLLIGTYRPGELLAHAFTLLDRLPADAEPAQRLELLQRRGAQRRAAGAGPAAADDFAAMSALARHLGLADVEVHALLLESSALGLVDRRRCLAAADRAVARHGASDVMLTLARGYRAYWAHRVTGYEEADARACSDALATVRALGMPGPLALFLHMNGCFQSLRSEYRAACEAADEGQRLARELGDGFAYQLCAQLRATVLLHVGELGDALAVLRDVTSLAERNGHLPGLLGARVLHAWLFAEAGDFARARRTSAEAVAPAERSTHPYAVVLAQLVLAMADVGEGRAAAAATRLEKLAARLEREPDLREWVMLLPLHAWLGEARLALGDHAGAASAARTLCAVARRSGERTYGTLGHRLLAEAALAERDLATASAEAERGLALAAAGDVPLAEWRMLATAARVAERRGHRAAADEHRARSCAVLRRLAGSLADEPTLRRALLRRAVEREAGPRARPGGRTRSRGRATG